MAGERDGERQDQRQIEALMSPIAGDYGVKKAGDFRRGDRQDWDDFLETIVRGSRDAKSEYDQARKDGFAGTGDDVDRAERDGVGFSAITSVDDAFAQEATDSVKEPVLEELARKEEARKVGSAGLDGGHGSTPFGTAMLAPPLDPDDLEGLDGEEGSLSAADDGDADAARSSFGDFRDDAPAGSGDGPPEEDFWDGQGSAAEVEPEPLEDVPVPPPARPRARPAVAEAPEDPAVAAPPAVAAGLRLEDLLPAKPGDVPATAPMPQGDVFLGMREAFDQLATQNKNLMEQVERSERRAEASNKRISELLEMMGRVMSEQKPPQPVIVQVEMPAGMGGAGRQDHAAQAPDPEPEEGPEPEDDTKGRHYRSELQIGAIRPKGGRVQEPAPLLTVDPPAGVPAPRPSPPPAKAARPVRDPRETAVRWTPKGPVALGLIAAAVLVALLAGLWLGGGMRGGSGSGESEGDLVQRAAAQKFYFVQGEMRELEDAIDRPEAVRQRMVEAVKAGETEGSSRIQALNAELQDAGRQAEQAKEAKTRLIRMTGVTEGGRTPPEKAS